MTFSAEERPPAPDWSAAGQSAADWSVAGGTAAGETVAGRSMAGEAAAGRSLSWATRRGAGLSRVARAGGRALRTAPGGDSGTVTLGRLCRLVLGLRVTVLAVAAFSITESWLLVAVAAWSVATVALLFGWSRDARPFLTRPVGLGVDLVGFAVVLLATGHDTVLVAAGYSTSLLAGLVLRWRGAFVGALAGTAAVWLSVRLNGAAGVPSVVLAQEAALLVAFAAVGALWRHTLDTQVETARRHVLSRAAASAAAEREELGRRLHDELAKELVGVQLLAEELRHAVRAGERTAEDLAAQLAAASRAAVTSSRRLVRRQRAGVPMACLADRLTRAGEQVLAGGDLVVECSIDRGLDASVSAGGALEAVLHEALDNVRRHACANRVEVRAAVEHGEAVLEVRDDGIGFPRGARLSDLVGRGSYGVLGMQERLAAVGGRLEVLAERGGTLVRAVVPAPETAGAAGAAGPVGAAGAAGPVGPARSATATKEVVPCESSWRTTTRSFGQAS